MLPSTAPTAPRHLNYTHNSTNDGGSSLSVFTSARYGLSSVAYNGYLYVIGGGYAMVALLTTTDVQVAPTPTARRHPNTPPFINTALPADSAYDIICIC